MYQEPSVLEVEETRKPPPSPPPSFPPSLPIFLARPDYQATLLLNDGAMLFALPPRHAPPFPVVSNPRAC